MATMVFNKEFRNSVYQYIAANPPGCFTDKKAEEEFLNYTDILQAAVNKGAMFDARVFNIPKEEVTNLVYWRQLDAIRNSIQMVGQANFSQKQLQGKSCSQIQQMLLTEKGIDWNLLPIYQQRGSCCVKEIYADMKSTQEAPLHTRWIIDKHIPIFIGEGREYINKQIGV